MSEIKVNQDVRSRNQQLAARNRQNFTRAGVFAINIVGSPGSGKTSLLEQTAARLGSSLRMLVIEGDIETERDAERIRAAKVPAIQIQTHGACHLDAAMIADSLTSTTLDDLDLLIIENVGNLICPVGFDLGEHLRVVVASTAEGDDKPIKYPEAYAAADVCVINKIDLLPHITFDTDQFTAAARRAKPDLQIFSTSCTTADGIDQWCAYLTHAARSHNDRQP